MWYCFLSMLWNIGCRADNGEVIGFIMRGSNDRNIFSHQPSRISISTWVFSLDVRGWSDRRNAILHSTHELSLGKWKAHVVNIQQHIVFILRLFYIYRSTMIIFYWQQLLRFSGDYRFDAYWRRCRRIIPKIVPQISKRKNLMLQGWMFELEIKSFHITCLNITSAYLKSRSMCLFDEKLELWSNASSSGVDTCIVSLSPDLASDLQGRLAVEYSSLKQNLVLINTEQLITFIAVYIFTYS